MSLPRRISDVVPEATAAAWPKIASVLPQDAYLAGGTALAVQLHHRVSRRLDIFVGSEFDPQQLATALSQLGSLTVTHRDSGALNGVLDGAKVAFLEARGQRLLDPPTILASIPVAGVRDILADKLKVIGDRGELRDYFDLMAIERQTEHRCEQGLAYYLARYGLSADHNSLGHIVGSLGYLDDVASDPGLPAQRAEIVAYWVQRQPIVARSLASMTVADDGEQMQASTTTLSGPGGGTRT